MAGLIQSVKGLKRKQIEVLEEERILPPACFPTQAATSTLPEVSSLPAYPAEFRLASPNNHMSQLLNTHITHTPYWFSLENSD